MSKKLVAAAMVAAAVGIRALDHFTGVPSAVGRRAKSTIRSTFGHSVPAGYTGEAASAKPEEPSGTTPTS
jgi:hypothetical protein